MDYITDPDDKIQISSNNTSGILLKNTSCLSNETIECFSNETIECFSNETIDCFSNETIRTYIGFGYSATVLNLVVFVINVIFLICILKMVLCNNWKVAVIRFLIRSTAMSLRKMFWLHSAPLLFLQALCTLNVLIVIVTTKKNNENCCNTGTFQETVINLEVSIAFLHFSKCCLVAAVLHLPCLKLIIRRLFSLKPQPQIVENPYCESSKKVDFSLSFRGTRYGNLNIYAMIYMIISHFLFFVSATLAILYLTHYGLDYMILVHSMSLLLYYLALNHLGLRGIYLYSLCREALQSFFSTTRDCPSTIVTHIQSVDESNIDSLTTLEEESITEKKHGNGNTNVPLLSHVNETQKDWMQLHSKPEHKMTIQAIGYCASPGNHTYTETQSKFIWEQLAPSVCRIKFQDIVASGFIVGTLRDRSTQLPHQYLLTCDHITLQDAILNHKVCKVQFIAADKTILTVKIDPRVYYRNKKLDYILVRLEHSLRLQQHLQTCPPLNSIITRTIPEKPKPMVIIGCQPEKRCDFGVYSVSISDLSTGLSNMDSVSNNLNAKQLAQKSLTDFEAVNNVRKRTYGKEFYPLNKKFTFYQCNSFNGTSGAPCFSVQKEYLYAMHCGSVYKVIGSDMEYGILLSHVVNDIVQQIQKENTAGMGSNKPYLTLEELQDLFPTIPIAMVTS